jgi:hypothetical protein
MQNKSTHRLVLNQESLRNLTAARPANLRLGETDFCETRDVKCPDSGHPLCPQTCSMIRQVAAK